MFSSCARNVEGEIVPQLRLMTGGPNAGGHGSEVCSLAFTPDGGFVLSGGWDGQLRLWEVSTGAQVTALCASAKAISACAVAPDGRQWLAGALDGMLSSWDPATHRQLAVVLAHTRPVSALLFTADGRSLVTASWDRSLGVWQRVLAHDGRLLTGHDDIVAGCRLTPDGGHLFSWSHDGTARVWDLARGAAVVTLRGHTDRVTAGAVAPDGVGAATGARDRVLTLWDLTTERPAQSACLGGEVRACFFLPDGESLVSIDNHGRVVLHALPDLDQRQELATGQAVQCAELAPAGGTIALGCADGRVRLVAVDGLDAAALLVTPTHKRLAPSRLRRLFGGRHVRHAYACTCPSCRHAFDLPGAALGQAASCPACRRQLRLSRVARPA
jgi:WD40 repeat protein